LKLSRVITSKCSEQFDFEATKNRAKTRFARQIQDVLLHSWVLFLR
jgi:hypothetical protein